jgi:hypothetical protein
VHQQHIAELTRLTPCPQLADEGVVAVHEGHGGHDAGGVRGVDELLGLVDVDRERLLADDVDSGSNGSEGVVEVRGVGRADLDDVGSRGDDVVERAEPGRHAPLAGETLGLRRAGAEHPDHLCAGVAGRPAMDRADHARADDDDAQGCVRHGAPRGSASHP